MFTKTILSTALVTACATTQPISMSDQAGGANKLLLPLSTTVMPSDATNQWFPQRVGEAELPSARILRTPLLATQDRFSIGVRLCVSPSGSVTHVELEQSSGVPELDRAALHDILGWQYESSPGPARLQTCAPMTLNYRP